MKTRQKVKAGKAWAMTVLGGLAAALAILWTPVGLLEMIVASLGLSEILAAAAPPLGLKARMLLALFAALMAMGIIAVTRREGATATDDRHKNERGNSVTGAKIMGFALSKLTAFARGRGADRVEGRAPTLRRADAHPDAPARAPIFASRDFGGLDIFARTEPGRRQLVVNAEPEQDPIVPATGLEMPSAPAPLPEAALPQVLPATIRPAFATPPTELATPVAVEPRIANGAPMTLPTPRIVPTRAAPTTLDTSAARPSQSISELTERLERGLAQRGHAVEPTASVAATPVSPVLAAMPPASPVPVRSDVAQDVDAALRAALGTLRTMTAHGR